MQRATTFLLFLLSLFNRGSTRIGKITNYDDVFKNTKYQKPKEPTYICRDSPVDLALVIDSSRSIYEIDFQKQMDFLSKFVTIWDIKPTKVRVAAVSFGYEVIRQGAFDFKKYGSTEEVQSGLRQITYRGAEYGEGTNTADAITFVRKRVFSEARPEAKKLCIVLTDGRSTDPLKTKEQAELLKAEGVEVVAIGIGNRVSYEELLGIASNADLVFTVESHSLLETIKRKLVLTICSDVEIITVEPPLQKDEEMTTSEVVIEPTTTVVPPKYNETTWTPPKKGCKGPLDINFVFNPIQIGPRRIIQFIDQSVSSKALYNDDVRVGVITHPFPDISGFRLNRYKNKEEISKHFKEYGTNYIAPQLADMRLEAFLPINGGRIMSRKIGVVFVRGKVDDELEAIVEAKSAHMAGIQVYVVSIGSPNKKIVVNNIASSPDYVLVVPNSNELPDLSAEFVKLICEK